MYEPPPKPPLEPPAPPHRPYVVKLTHLIALALIVALGGALRLVHLGADPPLALSSSNAEVMDGPWYLADAADAVRGHATHMPPQYRKPVFTATAFAAFAVGGVSLETAHAFAAVWGILLVLFGALGAYVAWGTRTALLAALFLAVSFVLVGYGRTPLAYGPLAAGMAGVFALHALGVRRHSAFHVAALALVAGLTVGLKDAAVALVPALVAGHVVAARERGKALLLAIGLVAGCAAAAYALRPELITTVQGKVAGYLGDADALAIVKRIANAPIASGLAIRAFPLLGVAWLGVLFVLGWRPLREFEQTVDRRDDDSLDATVVVWLLAALLIHAPFRSETEGGVAPLRYFAPALVPAALLAARTVVRTGEGLDDFRLTRPAIFAWALPAAYVFVSCAWIVAFTLVAVPERLSLVYGFFGVLAVAVALAALLAWRAAPDRPQADRRPPAPLAAALLFVAPVLLSDGAWLWAGLSEPTWSLRDANARVARALPPGSVVEGSFAHALTYDAPVERRFYETLRAHMSSTHLMAETTQAEKIETLFKSSGRPLTILFDVELRGFPVRVYRFPWAAPPAPGEAPPMGAFPPPEAPPR